MGARFDSFVVFAEMRTGSNFLENNLNKIPGVQCHGEVFNPRFMAYPKTKSFLGYSRAERDVHPHKILEAIREKSDGIGGFRFFHDHHPAVVDLVLDDPRCAKIILTRNPAESYVSWRIAEATDQWVLTHSGDRIQQKAVFNKDEFETHLESIHQFQLRLMRGLQERGQTAFYIAYEDIQNMDVLNGIAQFLGVEGRLEQLDQTLKKQNPGQLRDKVENYAEMEATLGEIDWLGLSRVPNFEPRRAPNVPSYVAAAESPLLFMPIASGPTPGVSDWMARLDGVEEDALTRQFTQKTLRRWKSDHKPHRSFTVLRHPVERAYQTFNDKILHKYRPGSYRQMRHILIDSYHVDMPREGPEDGWTKDDQYGAFLQFLNFVRASLKGQTALRVDVTWATQAQILSGFSEFAMPDLVLREDQVDAGLDGVCQTLGLTNPGPVAAPEQEPITLDDIYDESIEDMVRDVYSRDYMMFGFDRWK
nr:sulfotransferase family 2 domain-containing protein [Shimia ponticola]